jgi:hypothetical protein
MKRDTKKTASQTIRKLTLARETLRGLDKQNLTDVVGASAGCLGGTNSCAYSVCCQPTSQ